MGLSVSASSAIVFLGIFVAAGIVYPAVNNGVERVTEAETGADDRALAQTNTDVELVNATYDSTSGTLELTANNTGATTIDVNETNLLADNNLTTYDVTVAGDATTGLWQPGEQAVYTVDLGSAPDRVQLVVDLGIRVASGVEVI